MISHISPRSTIWRQVMVYGVNMRVSQSSRIVEISADRIVDYILFCALDVTLEPNMNEVSDAKYVSKDELENMFQTESCKPSPHSLQKSLTSQRTALHHGSSSLPVISSTHGGMRCSRNPVQRDGTPRRQLGKSGRGFWRVGIKLIS